MFLVHIQLYRLKKDVAVQTLLRKSMKEAVKHAVMSFLIVDHVNQAVLNGSIHVIHVLMDTSCMVQNVFPVVQSMELGMLNQENAHIATLTFPIVSHAFRQHQELLILDALNVRKDTALLRAIAIEILDVGI